MRDLSVEMEARRNAADAALRVALAGAEGGGKLLFAGRLSDESAIYIEAATKAGAAALVIAEELAVGKTAMRAGTVNFLVNSLDEALRILKNEIRKKQPVAVAVHGAFGQVVAEMKERGVQPELVIEDGLGLGGDVVKLN